MAATRLLQRARRQVYLSLAALHNNQLLLRGRSGKHDLRVVLQDIVQLLWGQIFQVSTVDNTGLGIPGGNIILFYRFN